MNKSRVFGIFIVSALLCATCFLVTGCGSDNKAESVIDNSNLSSNLVSAVVEQLNEMDISGAINEAANNAGVLEDGDKASNGIENEQATENMEPWITAIAEQSGVDPQDLPSVSDAYENLKDNQSNGNELDSLASLYFNKM